MPKIRFGNLISPFQIGNVWLRNRVVMPAMTTNFANRDGRVSNRLIEYYAARARGGTGLVIVEAACVDYPRGKGLIHELDISIDDVIPDLKHLAEKIRSEGAKAAIQLHHAGGLRIFCEPMTHPAVGPSSTRYLGYDAPSVLGFEQIWHIVECFAKAAKRACQAGFDAVEFHGAHGYLVAQFLSPRSNRRTDSYGGTPANRARFFCEILEASRRELGPDTPMICRIDADEFIDGGITIDDSTKLAARLEAAGADAIHVSISTTPPLSSREIVSNVPPMGSPEAAWINLTEKIKKACNIPVIAVGNIRSPELAERILEEDKADLIAMGRPLIADPAWMMKVGSCRMDDIRPCIGCNVCIRSVTQGRSDLVCAVNPFVGRETEAHGATPKKRKRILVLGGGPAGIEAAITADQRGHNVMLWESSARLGGALQLAAAPPDKEVLLKFAAYLCRKIERSGVKIRCGVRWKSEDIRKVDPDAVVIAVGAGESGPPGIKTEGTTPIIFARQVLSGERQAGDRILIVGGGAMGCEVADFLSEVGKSVVVVEQNPFLAQGMDPIRRRRLMAKLQSAGVELRVSTRLISVSQDGGKIASLDGTCTVVKADTVVYAGAPSHSREAAEKIRTIADEVFVIGDAMKPRGIQEAVLEGFMTGRRL